MLISSVLILCLLHISFGAKATPIPRGPRAPVPPDHVRIPTNRELCMNTRTAQDRSDLDLEKIKAKLEGNGGRRDEFGEGPASSGDEQSADWQLVGIGP